jgi:hypothetical protein
MWLRTAFYGAKMSYSREVHARLNGGRPGSLSQSRVHMIEGYAAILDKALRSLPLNDSQRALVSGHLAKIRAWSWVEQGKSQLRNGNVSEATRLFSEANKSSPQWKVALTLLGLRMAPQATSRLVFAWSRVLHGFST